MKSATELLGARIRELRKAHGLTQDYLAEILGVEQQYVSLMEHGKRYPSLDRLIRIAEVLKVPLPTLFEFVHLADETDRARTIGEMLEELNEDSQQQAFKIIQSVIKSLKDIQTEHH